MAITHPQRSEDPGYRTDTIAVRDERRVGGGLRIFQVLAAIAGGALFALGLAAVFQVDFGDRWFQTSADVAGFGFSAVAAIAALLLGGAILVSTLADQDRGGTAFAGLLSLVVGIAGLIFQDNAANDVQVDRSTASLFIVLGAAAFVLALVPWWSRRRTVVDGRVEAR